MTLSFILFMFAFIINFLLQDLRDEFRKNIQHIEPLVSLEQQTKLIENKKLIEKYKKNALTFSNTVFFKEDKLLKLLDNKLRYNA